MDREALEDGRPENREAAAIGQRVAERHAPIEGPAASPMPLTGPARPPIQVEDNMIEVGWAPEESSSPGGRDEDSRPKASTPAAAEGGEEAVRDHYAALQAWREWTENQVRRTPPPLDHSEDELEDEIEEVEEDGLGTNPSPVAGRPTVRVEGEQKFAPFGQLFSKMAHAREPE
jgi:hypothetical protein